MGKSIDEQIDEILQRFKEHIDDHCYPLEYCWPHDDIETKLLTKPLGRIITTAIQEAQNEARIDELEKWRTMIARMADYMDGKESLAEYDDRLAKLKRRDK